MTWEGYWWPNIVQWVLGATVSALVVAYVRHLIHDQRDLLLRILAGEPPLVVLASAVSSRRRKVLPMQLDRYRKAIAAGVGVLLIGLLTWATTTPGLQQLLEPLLPAELRPLVGVVIGGLATVLAVVRATNAPAAGVRRGSVTEPAPPVVPATEQGGGSEPAGTASAAAAAAPPPVTTTTAAAADSAERGPFWAGVQPGAPTTSTSIVELHPVPKRSPL